VEAKLNRDLIGMRHVVAGRVAYWSPQPWQRYSRQRLGVRLLAGLSVRCQDTMGSMSLWLTTAIGPGQPELGCVERTNSQSIATLLISRRASVRDMKMSQLVVPAAYLLSVRNPIGVGSINRWMAKRE
jgi:hypothetical protein